MTVLVLLCYSKVFPQTKYTGGSGDGYMADSCSVEFPIDYRFKGGLADGATNSVFPVNLFLESRYRYGGGIADGYMKGSFSINLPLGCRFKGGLADGSAANTMGTVRVQVKCYMEGPYIAAADQMNVTLTKPVTSPYSEDARTIPDVPAEIVDWVLIQTRITPAGLTLSSKSALLRKDGRIVGDDGTTDFVLMDAGAGDRYVVVRHRNHLSVMSSSVHTLSQSSSTLYNFSDDISRCYGSDGAKQVESGVYGMWAGDVNQDGNVTTTDYTSWYNSARLGESGYRATDNNMDGVVTTSDYTMWYNNARLGAASQVP
jgi:hypothetical protein